MKHIKTCNLLKELRAFCITKQEGSMSKAADALYASQPTVSLQIKALEREIDAKLFERRGPLLKLTTEGEILYDLVSPLVRGIDSIKDDFHAHYGGLTSGELTIAAEESTILYTLPEPVRQFVQQYPGIRLKLANVTGRDGREMLMSDKADISVTSIMDVPDTLEYFPFIEYNPILITPKGHPLSKLDKITLKDISAYGLILPPSHFSSWSLIKMIFALNGISYKVALEAGGWEVVKRYIDIGLGISIVTDICITEADRQNFEIITLEKYFPSRKYGVVTRKRKFLSAPAKRFIEILTAHYAQETKKIA